MCPLLQSSAAWECCDKLPAFVWPFTTVHHGARGRQFRVAMRDADEKLPIVFLPIVPAR